MPQSSIEFKGSNFTLSVIHLHDARADVISQALKDKIEQAPAFFQNAPVVLNVATLPDDVNWLEIKQLFNASGLKVVGVSGYQNGKHKQALIKAGLPLLKEGKEQSSFLAAPQQSIPTNSKIVDTPIRSGQQIYARNCDLIVTGSVSAGAELVADGNIHIYGVMRGRALAGAGGNMDSQIFCTHLSAELVSIAGEYWLSDQIPTEFYGVASRLRLQNNVLLIEPLT